MTTIYDAPANFALTALAGFCATHARLVRLVEGGVVRATEVPKGKVSIVVGGGSGHYPAGHPFHMVRKSVITALCFSRTGTQLLSVTQHA